MKFVLYYVLLVGISTGVGSDETELRGDWRCGVGYPAANDKPAKCNARSSGPCCSEENYCGISLTHCLSPNSIDFRDDVVTDLRCEFKEGDALQIVSLPMPLTFQVITEGKCTDTCLEMARHRPDITAVSLHYEDNKIVRCYCERRMTKIIKPSKTGNKVCMLEKRRYVCDEPSIPVRRCGNGYTDPVTCVAVLGCCYNWDGDNTMYPKCFHGKTLGGLLTDGNIVLPLPVSNVRKGNKITIILLPRIYTVSFELKLEQVTKNVTSVLHFTEGRNMKFLGDRIPAIFFEGKKLLVRTSLSHYINYGFNYDEFPLDRWVDIQVMYFKANSTYRCKVVVDGEEIGNVENNNPQEYQYVDVYASNPWHPSFNGKIRNLTIILGGIGAKAEEEEVDQSDVSKTAVRRILDAAEIMQDSIGEQWNMENVTEDALQEVMKKAQDQNEEFVESDAADNFQKVAAGMEMLSIMTNVASKFFEDITKNFSVMLKGIAPFLGAMGPAASLLSLFLGTESREYQRIKQLTNIVNVGFSRIERKLGLLHDEVSSLKALMKVLPAVLNLNTQMSRINKGCEKLQETIVLNRFQKKDLNDDFTRFITGDGSLIDAVTDMEKTLSGKHTVSGTSYCSDMTNATRYKRKSSIKTLLKIFHYMVIGASTHLQMKARLKHHMVNSPKYEMDKEKLIDALKKTVRHIQICDNFLKNDIWKTYWKGEIAEAAASIDYEEMDSIAIDIFRYFSKKYFWRIWMVWVFPKELKNDDDYHFGCFRQLEPFEQGSKVLDETLHIHIINLEKSTFWPNHYMNGMEKDTMPYTDLTAKQIAERSKEAFQKNHGDVGYCYGAVDTRAKVAFTPGYFTSNMTVQKYYEKGCSAILSTPSYTPCEGEQVAKRRFKVFQWG